MKLYETLYNERKGKKGTGYDTRIRTELSYGNKIIGELGLYAIRSYPEGKDLGYRVIWTSERDHKKVILEEEEKGVNQKSESTCEICGHKADMLTKEGKCHECDKIVA